VGARAINVKVEEEVDKWSPSFKFTSYTRRFSEKELLKVNPKSKRIVKKTTQSCTPARKATHEHEDSFCSQIDSVSQQSPLAGQFNCNLLAEELVKNDQYIK
jgi:hypothetical protein